MKFSWKNVQNNRLASPFGLMPPHLANPGSATGAYFPEVNRSLKVNNAQLSQYGVEVLILLEIKAT